MRQLIPWAMVWLRVALCPVVLVAAHRGVDGRWLGLIVLLVLLDDVYDGILARRWGCDTPRLRLADSCADTVFYLGAAGALWMREPEVLRRSAVPLGVLFGLEGLRYVVDLLKFGRVASYHSYLAKCWGLVMAVAVIGVFGSGGLGWLLRVSIVLGILANVEGTVMSLLLRRWQNDVKTLGEAWRLRGEVASEPGP